MLLIYHLAAAMDDATRKLLADSVILQGVTLNPDGYDRYAAWVNLHHAQRPNPDAVHREHLGR